MENVWHFWGFKSSLQLEYESHLHSNEHYLSSSKNKGWKKYSGLYWIWTHDPWDAGAMLYQLS